jgi:predicted ATPase
VPKIDGIKTLINDFFKNIRYIGPLREQPKDEYSIKGENSFVGTRGEFLAEVLENHSNDTIEYYQLVENDGLIKYNLVKSKLIDAVRYWVCDIFNLSSDVYAIKNDDAYSIFLVNSAGIKTTIKHVGFGISQILPIIVEGLRIPRGGTLILEQPEIHLHPKIQSLLFDFLNSLVRHGKSVIIESHSDHLITRMRRRVAEDESNTLRNKINLTFIESNENSILFRNIDLDDFGTIEYFPKDFIEKPDIELKAILKAQMKKRLTK